MKMGKRTVSILLGLSLGLSASAQMDPLLQETEQVVSTDSIDIDGMYEKQKKPSAADRIQKLRRQLEEKHEQMMRKRVEDMRLEEEKKLARKLERALQGQLQAMDTVSTRAAAPVVATPAPVKVEEKVNSFSVSGGFLNITGTETELDANMNLKVSMDTLIHPRFSVGFSVRYVAVEMTDRGDNTEFSNYNNPNYNYNYNNNYSYNQNGQVVYNSNDLNQRELKYSQLAFGLQSKFFFTTAGKIRPFAGIATAYNRGKLAYQDQANNSSSYNNQDPYGNNIYGDKNEIPVNNLSASVMAGADVKFTDSISANLVVQFDRTLTSNIEEEAQDSNAFYERRLKNIAIDIEDANVFSVNAGLSFNF